MPAETGAIHLHVPGGGGIRLARAGGLPQLVGQDEGRPALRVRIAPELEGGEPLGNLGVHGTERNIRNKISRGGLTAVFLPQVMAATGARNIRPDQSRSVTLSEIYSLKSIVIGFAAMQHYL